MRTGEEVEEEQEQRGGAGRGGSRIEGRKERPASSYGERKKERARCIVRLELDASGK